MCEAFYFILFASEAVGVICWPQGTWALLVVKFQPKLSVLRELQFLLTPQQDDTWAFLVPLPTTVLKENPGCSEFLQAPGRRIRITMKISHGSKGKGEARTPLFLLILPHWKPSWTVFYTSWSSKSRCPCLKLLQAVPTGAMHMQSSHCSSAWPSGSPNQARIPEQHQPEQRCSIFPGLLPFPGHRTKQNKRHPAEKDGWMDWWFGLFCVFAFKWEGIIGGGGREKKQYWGGLVIYGAHLLEKWISLWIQKWWACSQEDICSMLCDQWCSFSYAISTSASKNRA